LARGECEGVMRGATGEQRSDAISTEKHDAPPPQGIGTDEGTDKSRQRQRRRVEKNCSVEKEAKELCRLTSPPCACRVANCVCGVGDGWSCT
jgi:hypothetical protein